MEKIMFPLNKMEKFINEPSILTNKSTDEEYMAYINNMIEIQTSLQETEMKIEFIIDFFINKNKRYEILEKYIKSNRLLPNIYKSNLFTLSYFNIDRNETEKFREKLDTIQQNFNKSSNDIDKDTLYKVFKYYNKSIYLEDENWQPPANLEYMAWKERKDMITILKNKYDPTVKNALAYIINNDVQEYTNKIFTDVYIEIESLLGNEPINMNPTEQTMPIISNIPNIPNIPTILEKPKMNQILEKPIFYENCDMKGNSLSLDVGTHKLTKFTLLRKISSVKIPEKYTVKLYDSNNKVLILNKSVNCLKNNKIGKSDWNDRAVKIIIERGSSIEKFNNLNTKNIIVIVILVILILIIIMLIIKKKFFS